MDGASGEGFTNAGNALVMSPALFTKYLDAGKGVAQHAVLLPDGLRFSNSTTRRNWTNELFDQIRDLYRTYSDSQGASRVNLQGIVFDTNDGGRLPVEKYLAVLLTERESLANRSKSIEELATQHGLSPKYLTTLWTLFDSEPKSQLLREMRQEWRNAKPEDAKRLAAEIAQWQTALTRFQNVGHRSPGWCR